MVLLQFVCIELRTNLRCANVFLKFNMSVTSKNLRLHIKNNVLCIEDLENDGNVVNIPFEFSTTNDSFGNLLIEDCNVTFRLSLAEMENIVTTSKLGNLNIKSTYKCSIKQNDTIVISCVNCRNDLTAKNVFHRILEFPSDDINLADLFCHTHGSEEEPLKLIPKTTDLFFGLGFIVLNHANISNTREKEGHLYCNRCLQYLGITILDKKAVKLWTDSLWHTKCNENDIVNKPFPKLTIYELITKIIRETSFNFGDEQIFLHQFQFSRVLVEATFPSRKSKFLLLHLLEKEVPVLCNNFTNTNIELSGINILHMNNFKSLKLYYRCIEYNEQKIQKDNELKAWKCDLSVYNLKISPQLFHTIFKELAENSLMFPMMYRKCDNKLLSFILY